MLRHLRTPHASVQHALQLAASQLASSAAAAGARWDAAAHRERVAPPPWGRAAVNAFASGAAASDAVLISEACAKVCARATRVPLCVRRHARAERRQHAASRARHCATVSLTCARACSQRLLALLQQEKQTGGAASRATVLRVAVEGGGCSGFQYRFELDARGPAADDRRVRRRCATLHAQKADISVHCSTPSARAECLSVTARAWRSTRCLLASSKAPR